MTENADSSYYYSYDEDSYDYNEDYDYSYYSEDSELDKQIKYYKDAIVDLKLAREKDNALMQAQQIIQQQKSSKSNGNIDSPVQLQNSVPQHTQDIVEITKAAIKTAIESQAQVLASQLPQSRFIQHQPEQPLIGETQEIHSHPEQTFQTEIVQPPTIQQDNINQQQQEQVAQYESKLSQLENNSKLFEQQQDQVKQLTYQHQKQLQKLQEDNEKHKRDAENYAAKVDDREDIIKNLTKLLKKKDPNFNIANVLQNKQLIEQMVKMQQQDTLESHQLPVSIQELNTRNNSNVQQQQYQYQQQQQPFYQQQAQYNDDSQRYRQITRSAIELNNDDGIPFSPKRIPKGRLNPMSPTNSMVAPYPIDNYQKQTDQIKQQQSRSSINFNYSYDTRDNNVGMARNKGFGAARNDNQQDFDQRQPQVDNQQAYKQEPQYQERKPLNTKNYDPWQQQNPIDVDEFTRLKEENDNFLLQNTIKHRQTNFQLNWDMKDDSQNFQSAQGRRGRKSRNAEQEPQIQYQDDEKVQFKEQNTINQNTSHLPVESQSELPTNQHKPVMSFDEFLRERARYAAMKEIEAQQSCSDNTEQRQFEEQCQNVSQSNKNDFQAQNQAQNYQINEELQRELEELRKFKSMVQSQQKQQPSNPTLSNIYLNHISRDNTEESRAMLQAMPDYTQDAQEIRNKRQQALAENHAEAASQIEQNKRYNQQSTQIMRNLNPIDVNNPRYKMYRNVDDQYSAIQIQLQEHKNDLNKLYSHKITRKEQLKINFLEKRIKELENDAGKLRGQLKIFEQEFT